MLRKYTVIKAGFFYGTHQAVGAELNLHPKQAKYEIMAGNLVETPDVAAPDADDRPSVLASRAPRSRGRRATETAG